jgi:hypothetical protein
MFPVFGALPAVSGTAAGRLNEQNLLIAFPVEHGRLRIELVIELAVSGPESAGQW